MKTSIIIPDDIYNESKRLSDNFSSLVTLALKEYIKLHRIEKAKASFGKWENRDKDSVAIVNTIRSDKGRDYAKRTR